MENLLNRFKNYLQETLDIEVQPAIWSDDKKLPILFRDRYDFYTCRLINRQVLLMLAKTANKDTPATIKKHTDRVAAISDYEVVYVCKTLAAYNRNRLIKHKVSFVVPSNQLYLPSLGMDLREYICNANKPTERTFSPATQAVVLHAIYCGDGIDNEITPSELADRLGYTKMTLTRAVDELEAASLVEVETLWRERRVRFPMERKELWSKVRSFLRSPVKRTVTVSKLPEAIECCLAGESALSEYTMLAPPPRPTYAMTTAMWKNLHPNRKDEPKHILEEEAITIEIWHYLPFNTGRAGCVDPLSLLLSIGESTDERMKAALEELENRVSW